MAGVWPGRAACQKSRGAPVEPQHGIEPARPGSEEYTDRKYARFRFDQFTASVEPRTWIFGICMVLEAWPDAQSLKTRLFHDVTAKIIQKNKSRDAQAHYSQRDATVQSIFQSSMSLCRQSRRPLSRASCAVKLKHVSAMLSAKSFYARFALIRTHPLVAATPIRRKRQRIAACSQHTSCCRHSQYAVETHSSCS